MICISALSFAKLHNVASMHLNLRKFTTYYRKLTILNIKRYENPIEKSREPGCKETIRLAGQECLKNLLGISSKCIIRRTQSLLTKYLPVKFEHIVLCKMSDEQQKLYSKINAKFLSKIDDNMRGALATITDLKKICNHPCLLQSNDQPSAKKPSKGITFQLKMLFKFIRNTICYF